MGRWVTGREEEKHPVERSSCFFSEVNYGRAPLPFPPSFTGYRDNPFSSIPGEGFFLWRMLRLLYHLAPTLVYLDKATTHTVLHVLQAPPHTYLPSRSSASLCHPQLKPSLRARTERAAVCLGSAPLTAPPLKRLLGPAQSIQPDQLMA